ncbi:MAG: tandem-95 repeat protein [Bacillota bacterium]|nr:tandem-95 repeat protein [Bacillota bacterium]
MPKKIPPKLIMIIIVMSLTVIFSIAMLLITFIPNEPAFRAVDDTTTTTEDVAVTVTVLTNDVGEEAANITILSFTQPAHGYVIKYASGLRYTPYSNYFGDDSFTYTIQNPAEETSTATVNVTVTAVNDAPYAYNDFVAIVQDAAITIDVLSNDTDQDGDDLTIVSYLNPDHGTIVITEDNMIRYTPDAGYIGEDTFSYDIEDPDGETSRGTVTVTIRATE